MQWTLLFDRVNNLLRLLVALIIIIVIILKYIVGLATMLKYATKVASLRFCGICSGYI